MRACQTLATTGLTLFLLPEGSPPTPGPAWPWALGFPFNWTDFPESPFRVWLPTLLHLRCLVQSAWFEDFSRASASALVGRGDKYSLVGTSTQVTRGASFPPRRLSANHPVFRPRHSPGTEDPRLPYCPPRAGLCGTNISVPALPPSTVHLPQLEASCLMSSLLFLVLVGLDILKITVILEGFLEEVEIN